jgi:hypothetical protein
MNERYLRPLVIHRQVIGGFRSGCVGRYSKSGVNCSSDLSPFLPRNQRLESFPPDAILAAQEVHLFYGCLCSWSKITLQKYDPGCVLIVEGGS